VKELAVGTTNTRHILPRLVIEARRAGLLFL
jgi:hypothetical protein